MRFEPHLLAAALAELRPQGCERAAGEEFNSVLANLYRDGRDAMGWHSDDEPELGAQPIIASLSLGAPRRFVVEGRAPTGGDKLELELPHGSLLVMRGDTQANYRHALAAHEARPTGERINLTFRRIYGRLVGRRRGAASCWLPPASVQPTICAGGRGRARARRRRPRRPLSVPAAGSVSRKLRAATTCAIGRVHELGVDLDQRLRRAVRRRPTRRCAARSAAGTRRSRHRLDGTRTGSSGVLEAAQQRGLHQVRRRVGPGCALVHLTAPGAGRTAMRSVSSIWLAPGLATTSDQLAFGQDGSAGAEVSAGS